MNLAGESLMSEFNREILEEYGLFMIQSDPEESARKLRYYMTPAVKPEGLSLTEARADGARFAIVDPEPVKQQIIAYMKSGGLDMIAGSKSGSRENRGYHNLNHGPTIVSLPSRELAENSILSLLDKRDQLKNISGAFTKGTEKYLLGSYVLGTFNDYRNPASESHFFHNEVEYILCGKLTDEDNEKAMVKTIRTLRMPSNLAHIYSDPAKVSQLAAVSEAIAPGPAGLAVQAALGGAWAWAESSNDDSSASEDTGQNYGDDPEKLLKSHRPVIRPSEDRGLTYEQYLRILLFLTDEPQIVMRILDLIQINMRKDYDGGFLICEQSTGITYGAGTGGRDFSYDKKY